MNTTTLPLGSRPLRVDADVDVPDAVNSHSICWGAVFAGAAGAASLSLILLVLGVGLGLSSVSPWSSQGVSAETFGVSTIVWLMFTQLAASGLGGYLAGRLRHRWSRVHADEVYFRDTAHGFLAWSIATLVTAGMLTAAIGTIVSGGARVQAAVAGTASTAAAAPATQDAPPTAEVVRIFANAVSVNALAADDARYLGQLVAQRTGLAQQEAEKRVIDVFARLQAKVAAAREQAKEAADKARGASAKAALWGFISLLIGAFVASFLGTLGGRHRDQF